MKNIAEQSIKLNSSQGSQNRHTRRTLNRPAAKKLQKRMTIRLCRSISREGPTPPLPPKVRRATWGRWAGRLRARQHLAPPARGRRGGHAAPRQPRHRTTSGNAGAGSGSGSGNDDGDGEPPHPFVLDYDDLARLLRVAVGTLKNRYSRDPGSLPPAIILPGCRGPRWLLADVIRWLEDHRVTPVTSPVTPAAKRRAGRPRIAQQGKGGVA